MTVNMDKDYEDLYANLNSLLKDICTFLETKSLNLSPADKKKANTLIDRSKKHLQKIQKFTTNNENNCCETQEVVENSNENDSERYVDMTKNAVSPQRTLSVEPPLYESKCPFQDLPAKEASQEIKYGTLTKRRKVLNIIEVSTKIYAVIHGNWLLLYNSSKDLKPDCALDLKQYEAKEDETDASINQVEQSKEGGLKKNTLNLKVTSSFKVFNSSSSQKKCYSFVATTHKDMLQWVVNINRRHDKAVLATKHVHEEQSYEICQDFQDAEEEENIYNEIEMPCRSTGDRPVSLKIEENSPPAIPEKRPIVPKYVATPLPISTTLSPSTESMVSYEELDKKVSLPNTSTTSSLNSFENSEEDERTYYELDTVNKRKSKGKPILEENDTDCTVPSPSCMPLETDKKLSNNNDDAAYENGLTLQISPNKKTDLKSEVNELLFSVANEEAASNPRLEQNSPNPIIIKPKIISPKPWKPFKKSTSSKNVKSPQISKNRPIRESLRSQKKSSESSNNEENSTTSSNDCINSSSVITSLKPDQSSSIVQIIRSKWSTNHNLPCSLETFSRNTKIETFQASPIKETTCTDSFRSCTVELNDSLRPIDSLLADVTRNGKNKDEKPVVLLKPLTEEESFKKLKKSPVVPVKPKKAAKNS